MSIVYLVHDLLDPAVARRLRMFRLAGETPVLLGFRRGETAPAEVDGVAAFDLGRTEDARLGRRARSVLGQALGLGQRRSLFAGAEVILARNLEMLVLGWLLRMRFAPQARLVFECLDIHATLSAPGRKGDAMRGIERWLLRRCDGLIVSSPAFVTGHFDRLGIVLPPVLLVENKVLIDEVEAAPPSPPPAGPPWRIGWFGVIRCQRSLSILAALVRGLAGQVEVDIRGRPARNVLPEFDAVVAATPGLHFHGPYRRDRDLASIYGAVHFSWAIDYYEAGANSDWLLPNRLYEGGAHGTVPIASAAVETGQWLRALGIGVVLDEDVAETIAGFFAALSPAQQDGLRQAALAVPQTRFVCEVAECAAMLAWLRRPGAMP